MSVRGKDVVGDSGIDSALRTAEGVKMGRDNSLVASSGRPGLSGMRTAGESFRHRCFQQWTDSAEGIVLSGKELFYYFEESIRKIRSKYAGHMQHLACRGIGVIYAIGERVCEGVNFCEGGNIYSLGEEGHLTHIHRRTGGKGLERIEHAVAWAHRTQTFHRHGA